MVRRLSSRNQCINVTSWHLALGSVLVLPFTRCNRMMVMIVWWLSHFIVVYEIAGSILCHGSYCCGAGEILNVVVFVSLRIGCCIERLSVAFIISIIATTHIVLFFLLIDSNFRRNLLLCGCIRELLTSECCCTKTSAFLVFSSLLFSLWQYVMLQINV